MASGAPAAATGSGGAGTSGSAGPGSSSTGGLLDPATLAAVTRLKERVGSQGKPGTSEDDSSLVCADILQIKEALESSKTMSTQPRVTTTTTTQPPPR